MNELRIKLGNNIDPKYQSIMGCERCDSKVMVEARFNLPEIKILCEDCYYQSLLKLHGDS